MKVYNSLTKKLEGIMPINAGKIGLYSCGPTVYNNLHIGNLAAFIYADTLRRALSSNYDVNAVMNVTDVDDKTIRDSQRDYPELAPSKALSKLTQKYEDVFKTDITKVGIDVSALTFIRATDTIKEMILLTQQLLDKNIAYMADDGVYFSIKAYESAGYPYGVLQKIDRKHEHARVAHDEYDKDHVSDFALWKKSTPHEPSWSATFTYNNRSYEIPGRPGWHIECSAMSQKLLGVPFDIHTGGVDLKFPHHENEIAQSRGATGADTFANYFIHNNHILVDGKKMSKSLGNFFTLRDIEKKGYSPLAFRLLVLSSHYTSESNFSWEILDAAQSRLKNWEAVADLRWQLPTSSNSVDLLAPLSNNLNTPEALKAVDMFFDKIEQSGTSPSVRSLESIRNFLGIDLMREDIPNDQRELLNARLTARKTKDWALADELRDKLAADGISVHDTEHGQVWRRQ